MSSKDKQICPWCQTEIVWDPETGPEEECPYCFNELGEYRSVSFRMGAEAEADLDDEDDQDLDDADDDVVDAIDDLDGDDDYDNEDKYRDAYSENVERIIDNQEFAPECSNCRELMLYGGRLQLSGHGFTPVRPQVVERELLPEILDMSLYVCPSCFKTDTYLSEPGRLRLTQVLGEE
ncbi:hypothetical protein [Gorillibacterium massiliense]|uniref:hypothetical protein n=1 Tax=Gorillibacterium massiliense TaxID=1280390 RepID=UPI0004B261C6|nr:hypothetical protein [Gorillibacterium massiliense]